MDNAVWSSARWGDSTTSPPTVYARWNVRNQLFSSLLNQFKGEGSCTVTRRKLALGTKDSTTGWYEKTWNETEIEGIMLPRGTSNLALPSGSYVRLEHLFICADGVEEGDELKVNNKYYEVKGIEEHWLTLDNFSHRDCHLTELRMHDLSYINTSPSVNDARERTKTYWETYISPANLNNHNFIVCYANPDYPMIKVFTDKNIGIVFAVDQGTTESRMGVRYKEHVPTHVVTLDTELQWLGEAELRTVVDDHPEGSLRTLDFVAKHDRWLGSTRLYDTEFMLNYTRTSARGMA